MGKYCNRYNGVVVAAIGIGCTMLHACTLEALR